MARRSDHTREQLYQMALAAARKIVAKEGLRGLTTRRIAAKIGYSPGTLYQLFADLDDLVLRLNGTTLDALYAACKDVGFDAGTEDALQTLANIYIRFVGESPKLWAAVVEYGSPQGKATPVWYSERIRSLIGLAERALSSMYSPDDTGRKNRDAHILWAGLYGIASLQSAQKLPSNVTAQELVRTLVTTYVAGLRAASGGTSVEEVRAAASAHDR
ncbi:MAG: TetR/AcrR family transcriptional regulator [Hyphomicrobiales bacterium]